MNCCDDCNKTDEFERQPAVGDGAYCEDHLAARAALPALVGSHAVLLAMHDGIEAGLSDDILKREGDAS